MADDAHSPPAKKKWSITRFGLNFLVVSILAHLAFLSGATYFIVQRIQAKRKLTFQAGPPSPNPATQTVEHKVQMHKETTMSAPQMAKRITTTGLGKINLPEMPEMPMTSDEVKPMKMSSATSMGMGAPGALGGGGLGGISLNLPAIMADRCSTEGRTKSIADNGGDPGTDAAVVNALQWLKGKQNPDGTFGDKYKGGMTGLSLLCYLGHCERPTSGKFGPTVRNAIDAVIQAGNGANGSLGFQSRDVDSVYQHAIASYALGEAYILTKDEGIPPVLTKAVGMIVSGQRPDGGWAYRFAQPGGKSYSDTSVTCWMVQALKTAHYSGLNVPGVDAALDKAMNFLLHMQGENGVIGYKQPGVISQPKARPPAGDVTGAGVFCLLIWHHAKDKAVHDGLRVVKEGPFVKNGRRPPSPEYRFKAPTVNLYAWYYDTQACFQAGGTFWDWWNRHVEGELLRNQAQDGSWPPAGPRPVAGFGDWEGKGSDLDAQVYRTALCTLMLEVYYRYLSNSRSEGSVE